MEKVGGGHGERLPDYFFLCGNLSLSRLKNVLILAGLCSLSGAFTMTLVVVLSYKGLGTMYAFVFRHR